MRNTSLVLFGWIGLWLCAHGSSCSPQERCQLGLRVCLHPQVVKVCTRQGIWEATACATSLTCQQGQCLPATTPPSDAASTDMPAPELVSEATEATETPDCHLGDCVAEPGCQDGARRCDKGNHFQLCQQGIWSLPILCPSTHQCQQGTCQAQPGCQEGIERCKDNTTLEICQTNQWKATPCPAGQSCQNNRCSATTNCTEGTTSCIDAQQLKTCRAGQWQKTTCPAGQTCADGRCQATPFQCQLPGANPTIASRHWQHPKSPYAGQTITLSIQSDKVNVDKAPPLHLEITNRSGTRLVKQYAVVGGKTLYYLSAAGLTAGENCLVVKTDSGNVELATKVIAQDPGAGIPRGNGVWKITRNHQWTCTEQPTNGNLLHVYVKDEQGNPIKGAKVRIGWTDDTVTPIKPTSDAHLKHPTQMTTDSNGKAELTTPWGLGIRSPIDSKGWLVYQVSVEGGASDIATEITTGIWETFRQSNGNNCNYCNRGSVNVYGHWSYTIEFKRTPSATEICDVPTDHAGQSACKEIPHAYHEVGRTSCTKVAP